MDKISIAERLLISDEGGFAPIYDSGLGKISIVATKKTFKLTEDNPVHLQAFKGDPDTRLAKMLLCLPTRFVFYSLAKEDKYLAKPVSEEAVLDFCRHQLSILPTEPIILVTRKQRSSGWLDKYITYRLEDLDTDDVFVFPEPERVGVIVKSGRSENEVRGMAIFEPDNILRMGSVKL